MTELLFNTGERTIPEKWKQTKEGYLLLLRLQYAYVYASTIIPKDSVVLEIGFGDGYGTSMLSKKVKKIIGLDIDEDIVKKANKKYKSANCDFKIYDGKRLPFEDNSFDFVISMQVIEHIEEDISFVKEAYRILKKNGTFIATTPNKALRLEKDERPFNPFHVREYYASELMKALKTSFQSVIVYGIKGNDDIQRIELDRLKKPGLNRKINLGKLLPAPLKSLAVKLIRVIKQTNPKNRNFLEKYTINDYHIDKENAHESLDLVGICQK